MVKQSKAPKGRRKQAPAKSLHPTTEYFSALSPEQLPKTYQATLSFFEERFSHLDENQRGIAASNLRQETIKRIEAITQRPLICYTSKIYNPPQGGHASINNFDLVGFSDLISTVSGEDVDIFIISNGGEVEATDRIVTLLRERFNHIRYIIPSHAFSAATLLCFSGNEIIIGPQGTLGPIDPQMNGVPIQAILQSFNKAKEEIEKNGMNSLLAYWPLLTKYELPILEVCEQYDDLSKLLAKKWLGTHMLQCTEDDPRVKRCVGFFSDYETHKSHGRSISRKEAASKYLIVHTTEESSVHDLVQSLYVQYVFWFDKSVFAKFFENSQGIHWGWKP
jgi:hypothetical protein